VGVMPWQPFPSEPICPPPDPPAILHASMDDFCRAAC
jgi:hypothetical protein